MLAAHALSRQPVGRVACLVATLQQIGVAIHQLLNWLARQIERFGFGLARQVAGSLSRATRRPTSSVGRVHVRATLGLLALGLLTGLPAAHAQDVTPREDLLVIPPPPSLAAPRYALEVHTGLTLPLDNNSLCPSGAGCVLEAGGGIGVSLERRWPSGFGALAAYDVWFLDSDSVYELAVQQLLRGGMRYTMPTDFVFHPIFELSLGVMGLGDIFRIATGGMLVQAFSGVEAELTESVGVRVGMGLRAFSHSSFRTERDGVRRGDGVRFSEAFFVEVGLTVM